MNPTRPGIQEIAVDPKTPGLHERIEDSKNGKKNSWVLSTQDSALSTGIKYTKEVK